MSDASDFISDLLSAIEEAAGSGLSASLATKLKVGASVLGETGDLLEGALTSRLPHLPQIIQAAEGLVKDTSALERDTVAFFDLVKHGGDSSATATPSTAS